MIRLHTFKVLATNPAIWPSASITKDNRSLSLKYRIFLSPALRNMQHLGSMAALGKSDLPTSQPLIVHYTIRNNCQDNTSKTKKLTCNSHSISANNGNIFANYSNVFTYFPAMSNTFGCRLNQSECSVVNQPSASLWGNESVIHGIKINLHTGCLKSTNLKCTKLGKFRTLWRRAWASNALKHWTVKVAVYRDGHGQRSKRNNSQWVHVLGYSRKPWKMSREAQHKLARAVMQAWL